MKNVIFAQPFSVSAKTADEANGKVIVVDLAFNGGRLPKGLLPNTQEAAQELHKQFLETTGALISALGERLVAWIDHHPHAEWSNYKGRPNFYLFSREEAPSCPSIISPSLLGEIGEFDTIIAHGDFDGIMSAVICELGGRLPYPSAVKDAVAADTRVGRMSKRGILLEAAMKASLTDDSMRLAIFQQLVSAERIRAAAKAYEAKEAVTRQISLKFKNTDDIAIVNAMDESRDFDLTQVLLNGQNQAKVAIVLHKSTHDATSLLTVAGPASYNFPNLLGLGGGAPFRATVNADRLSEVLLLIKGKMIK